jgi:hypothetical protein
MTADTAAFSVKTAAAQISGRLGHFGLPTGTVRTAAGAKSCNPINAVFSIPWLAEGMIDGGPSETH